MIGLVMLVMVGVAVVGLVAPLFSRRGARNDPTAKVLKAQLGELGAEERVAAARRILAETPTTEVARMPLGRGARVALSALLVLVVAGATFVLYAWIGRPELIAPASAHGPGSPPDLTAELENRVLAAPGDAVGWSRLGLAYMRAGRFNDAAMVYGRAARLQPQSAEYLSAEGEAFSEGAGGNVTPAADAAFQKALSVDPSDPRARYYLALEKDQRGDHRGAMADWVVLLKSAPPGAPWLDAVRGYVAKVAAREGVDLDARLGAEAPPSQPKG